jgi:hypothetical protein
MISDCEKCWNTPCICGWAYRNWSKKKLIMMRDMFQQLIDGTHEYSNYSDNNEHKNENCELPNN